MTDQIAVIDPGKVTGLSTWAVDPDYPIQRLDYHLIKGGMEGFVAYMGVWLGSARPDLVICEKWNEDDGRDGDGTWSLRIEGCIYTMCEALGIEVIFMPNSSKALCHDSVLKRHGLWLTGREPEIDHEDGRDVNDTQRLALAWAKITEHQPTLLAFWPEDPS